MRPNSESYTSYTLNPTHPRPPKPPQKGEAQRTFPAAGQQQESAGGESPGHRQMLLNGYSIEVRKLDYIGVWILSLVSYIYIYIHGNMAGMHLLTIRSPAYVSGLALRLQIVGKARLQASKLEGINPCMQVMEGLGKASWFQQIAVLECRHVLNRSEGFRSAGIADLGLACGLGAEFILEALVPKCRRPLAEG